jgi:undecaprenyl-diphosphatase
LNLFQAILLGIVQGITEFFPISSSAHLKLTRHWLGLSDGPQWIYFDLACHFGTLAALILCLRKSILAVLKDQRQIALFTSALLPLVPAYFLLKPLREYLSAPVYTSYFLWVTAGLLFLARRRQPVLASHALPPATLPKFSAVICIGAMQALALLPGLSRSGSTIAAARLCGWSWIEGARFSFLLAVPTILGGELLETWKWAQGSEPIGSEITLFACALAAAVSFGVALFSIRAMFWVYERGDVRWCGVYCLLFGLLFQRVFHG